MRAPQKISPKISPKIGLIAGQGDLPVALIRKWQSIGIVPVIVGLRGTTPESLLNGQISAMFSIGQAGHILAFLKEKGVTKLVMAGGLKRPNFWTLRTDMVGLWVIAKLIVRRFGDDGLLKFLRREIEQQGIQVMGVQDFLPEIVCPAGVLGTVFPTPEQDAMIATGFLAAKRHGAADKGQSIVITPQGHISFETAEGTNALILSCAGQAGAILVKVSKPQQDLALDMPTIGPGTMDAILKAGLKGIAVEAGKTILLDRDRVVRMCNDYGVFMIGVENSNGF